MRADRDPSASSSGLRDATQQVFATLVDIGRSRLELASVEIEEERLRIARLWIASACTLFFAFAALLLLAAFLVLWCQPENRLAALGALTALAAAAGLAAGWRWRRLMTGKPALLQATLEELRNDGAALQRGAKA